jgi:hypothetical protein
MTGDSQDQLPSESNGDTRMVTLRNERNERGTSFIQASLEENGDLTLHGEDSAPQTSPISTTGYQEWFRTVDTADIPNSSNCGGQPGDHAP